MRLWHLWVVERRYATNELADRLRVQLPLSARDWLDTKRFEYGLWRSHLSDVVLRLSWALDHVRRRVVVVLWDDRAFRRITT